MAVRPLTSTEQIVTKSLRKLGLVTGWEWMAALDGNTGEVISFRTDKLNNSTAPDKEMYDAWAMNNSLIIHHNHPSGESLSSDDWFVLSDSNQPVSEIFAHVVDGTQYYGKILCRDTLSQNMLKYAYAEAAAQKVLNNAIFANPLLCNTYGQATASDAGLRKHTVALALAQKGGVIYDFNAGLTIQELLTEFATEIQTAMTAAFNAL